MLHAGLDLSRRRVDVCLVDDAGELVEHTAAAPDTDGLRRLAERLRGVRVRAVIESMTGARFVHDVLERCGWDVQVADEQKVWRIDPKGKATVFAAPDAFPRPPQQLHGIAVDETGTLHVADRGVAIFRIDPKGKVTLVVDAQKLPALKVPGAIINDGLSHLLVGDSATGELHRVKLASGTAEKLADGLGNDVGDLIISSEISCERGTFTGV